MAENAATGPSRVTVVVVPRERFSRTEVSLESVYRHTTEPFELIYVDAHSPPPIQAYLERQAREKGFRLVRLPHFVPTSHARNIGLRYVTTPYVLFIENDMLVRPGWLEALIRCAEETGAPVVGPLYLEHRGEREIVHMAGGVAHLEAVNGARRCIERHFFQGRTMAEVSHLLRREPTEMIEFHCVLLRTDLLRAMGGFDEGMKNTGEHVDFCLTMHEAGVQIYLEPASVVVYIQPPPFTRYDVRFYCTRWHAAWARQTVAHFAAKWRLDPDDPFLSAKANWTTTRRRDIFTYFLTRAFTSRRLRYCLTVVLDFCIGKTIARPAASTLKTVVVTERRVTEADAGSSRPVRSG
jgi:GT2 family glycosyltransferase